MVATVALMSTVLHSCLLARPPIIYARPCGAGIVQAVARDLLTYGMYQVEEAGREIVMHVHDEIVVENTGAIVDETCGLMAMVPAWRRGYCWMQMAMSVPSIGRISCCCARVGVLASPVVLQYG